MLLSMQTMQNENHLSQQKMEKSLMMRLKIIRQAEKTRPQYPLLSLTQSLPG